MLFPCTAFLSDVGPIGPIRRETTRDGLNQLAQPLSLSRLPWLTGDAQCSFSSPRLFKNEEVPYLRRGLKRFLHHLFGGGRDRGASLILEAL